MNKNEFAQKIIMLRGALGLTQEEFAKEAGVSKRSVSSWENGDVIPKKTVRINLAVTYNLPVNELLLDEEKPQNINIKEFAQSMANEDELLSQLKNVIENSNIHKQTKDKYMTALYQTFNSKERD